MDQAGTAVELFGQELLLNKFAIKTAGRFDLRARYTTSDQFAVALFRYWSGADGFVNAFFPVFSTPGDWLSGTGRVTAHGSLAPGFYNLEVNNFALAGYPAPTYDLTSSSFSTSHSICPPTGSAPAPTPTPEPSSVLLIATGAAFLALRRWGRTRHRAVIIATHDERRDDRYVSRIRYQIRHRRGEQSSAAFEATQRLDMFIDGVPVGVPSA